MEINLTTDNPNPGSAPGMFWISRFSVPGRIPGKTDRNILCAKRRAALQLFHRRRSNPQYVFLFGSPSTIRQSSLSSPSKQWLSDHFRSFTEPSCCRGTLATLSPSGSDRRGLHRFDGTRRRRRWSSACCPQTTYYTYGAGKCDVAIRLTYGGPFALVRDLVMESLRTSNHSNASPFSSVSDEKSMLSFSPYLLEAKQ
jgi:hypothetical protein